MKKLTVFLIAAAFAACVVSPAAYSAEKNDDAGAAILAQTQKAKAENKAKAASADAKQKAKTTTQQKSQTTAANTAAQKSAAAATVDQIVKEETQKASKEAANASNNKGTVASAQQTTAVKTDKKADTAAAKQAGETAVKAAAVKTAAEKQPQQAAAATETKTVTTAAAPAAAAVPAADAEALKGRPLNPTPMEAGPAETEETVFVSAEWLKKNINSVSLIDARAATLYSSGHIQGAVNAQWQYFANMSAPNGSEKWGTMLPPATMSKRIGSLGVNGKKLTVIYCDGGGWGQSGWVLWIFRQCGIKNARLLEGGLTAWKKAGGKVVKTRTSVKNTPFTVKKYVPDYVATTEWINDNLGKPGLTVIDVRTEYEYLGKIKPFQEKRAGHLPGAINIPREKFLQDDNGIISEQATLDLLAEHGVKPEDEIVVYDTAGVRGAFVTMVLRAMGFQKCQNYDAGFQAWAGNSKLPLVKP